MHHKLHDSDPIMLGQTVGERAQQIAGDLARTVVSVTDKVTHAAKFISSALFGPANAELLGRSMGEGWQELSLEPAEPSVSQPFTTSEESANI